MDPKFAIDVFLSHNAQDKPRVRRLAQRLKEARLRVLEGLEHGSSKGLRANDRRRSTA
jgi:hypothetical protein